MNFVFLIVMEDIETIRNALIDKIQAIDNSDFLKSLDEMLASISYDQNIYKLTSEQKEVITMSLEDIKYGRIISQNEMKSKAIKWLKEKD